MAQKILVTNFKYSLSREEYEQTVRQLGQAFADVPGCSWKIWTINAATNEAGAVYLFDSEKALEDFKASPLVAGVLAHPALSDFELRERDILRDVSEVTRAPLMGATVA